MGGGRERYEKETNNTNALTNSLPPVTGDKWAHRYPIKLRNRLNIFSITLAMVKICIHDCEI